MKEVLAYMNKERKLALEDYLYVFGGVAVLDKVMNVRLLSIDSQCMTILFNHKEIEYDIEKTIVFEPPLEDCSKAKERLQQMAYEAAAERKLAPFQINGMSYPSSIMEYLIIFGVLLPVVCYNYRPLLHQLPISLSLCEFLDNDIVLRTLMALMFLTHLIESLVFLRPKLNFYRVPPDFLIEWYLFGILEGYSTVRRLKEMASKISAVNSKS